MLKKDSALLIVLAACGVLSFFVYPDHDYRQYIRHWRLIALGESPWQELIDAKAHAESTSATSTNAQSNDSQQTITALGDENAYGPLYAVFAIFWPGELDESTESSEQAPATLPPYIQIPRLIFFAAWIAGVVVLLRCGYSMQSPWIEKSVWKWMVFANPAVIIFTALFGQLDAMLAALCGVAVMHWHRQREVSGGLLLAAGVGIKFYPLILLGAAATRVVKGRFVFPLTVIAGVAAIFGVAYLIWGSDCLVPLTYATERPSKKLSIFRFLRGSWSPLSLISESPNADHLSGFALLGSLVIVTICGWWYRWRIPFTSLLLAWCVVMFYKVGHMNLYFWTLPLAFYFVLNRPVDQLTQNFVKAFMAFWAWLSLIAIIYFPTRFEGPFADLREWISLPTFALAIWVLATLIKIAPTEIETDDDFAASMVSETTAPESSLKQASQSRKRTKCKRRGQKDN